MASDKFSGVGLEVDTLTNGEVSSQTVGNQERFVWNGDGVFDKLMNAIDKNLQAQYDNGRITGSDYATIYSQLLQAALSNALQFSINKENFKLQIVNAKNQDELSDIQKENLKAQTAVYNRQLKGFDDNLLVKLFQAQHDSFGMIFSSGMLDFDQNSSAFPAALKSSAFTDTYNKLYKRALGKEIEESS